MTASKKPTKYFQTILIKRVVIKPIEFTSYFFTLSCLALSFFVSCANAQNINETKQVENSLNAVFDIESISTLKETNTTGAQFSSPFTSYLPADSQSDPEYWLELLKEKSLNSKQSATQIAEQKQRFELDTPIEFNELEPNNNLSEANVLEGLGSANAQNSAATVRGNFGTLNNEENDILGPFTEDDGDINKAPFIEVLPGVITEISGTIDPTEVPFSCDIDMVGFMAQASANMNIRVNSTDGQLDPMLWVYDENGVLIANNDDFQGLNSGLSLATQTGERYYIAISGFLSILDDPFDSSSCNSSFASSGDYILSFSSLTNDLDFFSVELRAGDVLGVSLDLEDFSQAGLITLHNGEGNFIESSEFDFSFIYPADSPLPGGGHASIAFTVSENGTYNIELSGTQSNYEASFVVVRPTNETSNLDPVLFLDFDGEIIDALELFSAGFSNATLSPLNTFLTKWDLTNEDEDALIDQIIDVVSENLIDDLQTSSFNPEHDLIIHNSRDHKDTFGSPGISRIIVGGTIDEIGFATIGIAQSIDPGNFDLEETAVVLLDALSDSEFSPTSLNRFKQEDASKEDIIALVAQGVGNIIAHEAGHFYGNFHTQINEHPGIMDQGGDLPGTVGVGEDELFNTEDDQDVDFITDTYNPGLGRVGEQDTLNIMAVGLLSNLPPVLINTNTVEVISGETVTIPLSVFDLNSQNTDIELSVISSDESLLSTDEINIIRGEEIELHISPSSEISGTVTVTIIADDGFFSAESDIRVSVTVPNQAPVIEAIENTTVVSGTPITIPLNITDDSTAINDLEVTINSSDEALLTSENIDIISDNEEQQIQLLISPVNTEQGITSITITVSDGSLSSEVRFDIELDIPNEPPIIDAPSEASGIVGNEFVIPFSVSDIHSDNEQLDIRVESLSTNTLSNSDIQINRDGTSSGIILSPMNVVPVEASIRLSVSDEEFTTTQDINLFIDVPNTAPEINTTKSLTIRSGESETIQISITDIHTPTNELDIEIIFGSELLSSTTGLIWNSDFSQASLSLNLNERADEDTIIVITVSDGEFSTTQTINVNVQPLPERFTRGGGAFSWYTLLCFMLLITLKNRRNAFKLNAFKLNAFKLNI